MKLKSGIPGTSDVVGCDVILKEFNLRISMKSKKNYIIELKIFHIQSNLCTTTTLGTQKIVAVVNRWLLFRGTFML